ncbi:hypothetical protein GS399_06920 [Pedobacter sp. HMF7647]|uniref:SdpI family protein n=1 Tax=Hufsiella arboris TaxID=2695275 RepID=A0A7K1Y8K1_9SPHI|nr:hypothetical protein [Hufsiella arboris]
MITLLVGMIFIATGILLKSFPPKKINSLYGYRTFRSMKNQATWDFANRYSAKLLIVFGAILCLIGLISSQVFKSSGFGIIIGFALVILAAVSLIVITEKRLNKVFDSTE